MHLAKTNLTSPLDKTGEMCGESRFGSLAGKMFDTYS